MLWKPILSFLMRCGNLFEMFKIRDLMPVLLKHTNHPLFSKDPWPLPLRGMPLGHMTNLVRHQEQTLKVLVGLPYIYCVGCNLAPKMILSHPVGALRGPMDVAKCNGICLV